jgi:hypothetical protein
MNSKWTAALTVAMGTILLSGAANAQEPSAPAKDEVSADSTSSSRDLPAANRAVELTIGTGYAQGLGNVATRQAKLTDVGTAGGAVEGSVGYRLIPPLTLGVYGSGAMFGRGDQVDSSANLYSATAGVQADWHFLPSAHDLDPWVSLGSGWRGYWIHADQGTTSIQGLEMAKLRLGVDYRISPAVAISPVIGADLSLFLSQSNPASNGSFSNISSPNVNTFVFAGLLGRFDVPTDGSASKVAGL